MDSGSSSSDYNEREVPKSRSRILIVIAVVLTVALIISSVVAAGFYLNQSGSLGKPNQPKFVRLLTPKQVSTLLGGNWSEITPNLLFFNSSNSAGLFESEYLQKTGPPAPVILTVHVMAYNYTVYSKLAYAREALGFVHSVNQTSYSFSRTQNVSLFGFCNQKNVCSAVTGISISSLYLVEITLSEPVEAPAFRSLRTSQANQTAVESLVREQLSLIG